MELPKTCIYIKLHKTCFAFDVKTNTVLKNSMVTLFRATKETPSFVGKMGTGIQQ